MADSGSAGAQEEEEDLAVEVEVAEAAVEEEGVDVESLKIRNGPQLPNLEDWLKT